MLKADQTTELHNLTRGNAGGRVFLDQIRNGSYAVFAQVDLTGVKSATPIITKMGDVVGGELELRIDGPDGKLIGKTDFKRAKENQIREGIISLTDKLSVERTTGKHDLYVIFKNPSAGDKRLFIFGQLGLSNK